MTIHPVRFFIRSVAGAAAVSVLITVNSGVPLRSIVTNPALLPEQRRRSFEYEDCTSWILMHRIQEEELYDRNRAGLNTLTTELAHLTGHAHQASTRHLTTAPTTQHDFDDLATGTRRHLEIVLSTLDPHHYQIPAWQKHLAWLCNQPAPTILHGDLTFKNLIRDANDHRLTLLDSCGVRGPAEFDAARWAARTGGAAAAKEVLDTWTTATPHLNRTVARGFLGIELLMQAGVRSLVAIERGKPLKHPDLQVRHLLAEATCVLHEVSQSPGVDTSDPCTVPNHVLVIGGFTPQVR